MLDEKVLIERLEEKRKKAASVLPEAVDAVSSTLSSVLKMASAAAT